MALHDLVGRLYGVPVFELLGGAVRESLPSNQSIFYGPPDVAARQAAAYVADGFRSLKVRVGLPPFERDVDRVEAVRRRWARRLAGDRPQHGVDATRRSRTSASLEPLRPRLRRAAGGTTGTWTASATSRSARDVPIMADESVQSLDDVSRDRARPGRRSPAPEADQARRHRRALAGGGGRGGGRASGVMVGQTNEGGLATAAAAHCALAVKAAYLELYGAEGLEGGSRPRLRPARRLRDVPRDAGPRHHAGRVALCSPSAPWGARR